MDNGLGDRVSQTVNGTTANFILDLNSGLTQVLQESAPQGYGAYTYLYGTDRIAQYGATSTEYFLGDALGSVRQMVDASGAVILAKSYDPFGNAKVSTGTGASRYGYTGESMESWGGVYLRARYYSSTGRFTSRDTWAGDAYAPMSYNAWLYGYANPVRYTDPSGFKAIQSWYVYQMDLYKNINELLMMGFKPEDLDLAVTYARGENHKLTPKKISLIEKNFATNSDNVQDYQRTFGYSADTHCWTLWPISYGPENYNRYDWLFEGWVEYWQWRADLEGADFYVTDPNLLKAIAWKETKVGVEAQWGGPLIFLTRQEINNLRGEFDYSPDKEKYGMNWGLMDLPYPISDPSENIAAVVRFLNAKYTQYLKWDEAHHNPIDEKSVWIDVLRSFGPHEGASDYDPNYGIKIWDFKETGTFNNSVYVFGNPPSGFNR